MSNRVARARGQAGFTLVELLVVIAILGILSGVVVFAVRGIGDKGRGVAVATDERILRTAEESYCAQNGRYASEDELVTDGFLTGPSEIHAIVVGDNADDRLVFPDPTVSTGNCGDTYKHYQIVCRDGSQMPGCGSGSPSPTSTTLPPVNTWAPLSQGPTSRLGAGMAEYPPTAAVPTGALVMFGGSGPSPANNPGETWLWTGSWAVASQGELGCDQEPPPVTRSPCPRVGHSMAYDASRRQVVMVGGRFDSSNGVHRVLRETWTWKDLTWTQVPDGATARSPQSVYGAMAYDAERRDVVLFGGVAEDDQGIQRNTDATWVWRGAAAGWHQVNVPGPSARQGASMAYDAETKRLILFGGLSVNSDGTDRRFLNDMWAWDGNGWSQLAPMIPWPVPRAYASMASMPAASGAAGGVVLFGGTGQVVDSPDDPLRFTVANGGLSDTWEWSRNTWTERHPTTSPPGRGYAPLVYYQPTHQLVMFGGSVLVASGGSPETWGYKSAPAPTTTVPPTTVP